MKKILFFTVIVFACSQLNAQQDRNANALKINPLSLFLATGNVSYERAVSHNQSFQLGVFYSGVGISDIKYSGVGITPEYRFYFAGKKDALNGVYAAPFLRYQHFSLKNKSTSDETSYSTFGGGALLGWQKMWDSGFVLDLFAGPALNQGKFKNESDEDDFDISSGIGGFGIRTGITLGFGF